MAKKKNQSQRRFGDSDLSNAIAGRVVFRLPGETQFTTNDQLFAAWRESALFRKQTYAWFRYLKSLDAQSVRTKQRPRIVDLIDVQD